MKMHQLLWINKYSVIKMKNSEHVGGDFSKISKLKFPPHNVLVVHNYICIWGKDCSKWSSSARTKAIKKKVDRI
ncbi:hypothetical protein H5410_040281 [Solanum commersonii]|uniref:Uncharacterized protein n=1 Tax=Solanum commersonii TaxID=4109 RepID=A0A9J5XQI0_SOLCO|nr:hypothetical protein H5410_040281 [Solanum commersonii]